MRPDRSAAGARVSARRASHRTVIAVLVALVAASSSAAAQVRDSVPQAARVVDTVAAPDLPRPPISPRRAFVTSFLFPGYAQARLDRPTASAVFFGIEAGSLLMLGKTLRDLRVARRLQADSLPLTYVVDETGAVARDESGAPVVATWTPGRYTAALVGSRRQQVEDWMAVIIFNHLFAGAEAFVSAHLWDVPTALSVRPTVRGGTAVTASFRW